MYTHTKLGYIFDVCCHFAKVVSRIHCERLVFWWQTACIPILSWGTFLMCAVILLRLLAGFIVKG